MFGFLKKPSATTPQLHADQLQPRIKHHAFARALLDAGMTLDQAPLTQQLCGELLVTYAFDHPDQFIMATPDLLEQVGVTRDDLPDVAMSNLIKALNWPPKELAMNGVHRLETGGHHEAILVIMDQVCEQIEGWLTGPAIAAVPHRDCMLFCDGSDAAAIEELRRQATEQFEQRQDNHRLSPQVMVRREGFWRLYDEN